MKKEKRYDKIRLGALKKLSQNYDLEKRSDRGYWRYSLGAIPIIESHHRHDPWVIWLREKLEFGEI